MIYTHNILSEFVDSLGSAFSLDVINKNGVAFHHRSSNLYKFSLATAPMFGVKDGHVGFVVTRNGYPIIDSTFRIEDPEFLNKVKLRISEWVPLFAKP